MDYHSTARAAAARWRIRSSIYSDVQGIYSNWMCVWCDVCGEENSGKKESYKAPTRGIKAGGWDKKVLIVAKCTFVLDRQSNLATCKKKLTLKGPMHELRQWCWWWWCGDKQVKQRKLPSTHHQREPSPCLSSFESTKVLGSAVQ